MTDVSFVGAPKKGGHCLTRGLVTMATQAPSGLAQEVASLGDGRPVGVSALEAPTAPHVLTFNVYGVPAPQGSKRHVGHGVMVESSKKVKPWRQDVAAAGIFAVDGDAPPWEWVLLDGPLAVTMVFSFIRPKSHYRTGKNAHLLKDDAPCQPCSTPDLSKLARSTEDALTGIVWRDDARISEYDRLAKVWCGEDPDALFSPGAVIKVRPL